MIHTLTYIRMPSIGAPLGIERAELRYTPSKTRSRNRKSPTI